MRVLPVIDPVSVESCVTIVDSLITGGCDVIEITLRTDTAWSSFERIKQMFPKMILGAGSVMSHKAASEVSKLGADFTVSPCIVDITNGYSTQCPHISGVATPRDILDLVKLGEKVVKFYPAEAMGGSAGIRDLTRIFPGVFFYQAAELN